MKTCLNEDGAAAKYQIVIDEQISADADPALKDSDEYVVDAAFRCKKDEKMPHQNRRVETRSRASVIATTLTSMQR